VALINPLHECLNGRVEFISRKKLTGIKLATAPGISEFFFLKTDESDQVGARWRRIDWSRG
jgi:hypothetical protein